MKTGLEALQARLDHADDNIDELQRERDTFKGKWETRELEYGKLETKLQLLVDINKDHANNIKDLTEQNTRLSDENKKIKDERDDAIREKGEAIQAAANLETLVDKQQKQLDEADRRIVVKPTAIAFQSIGEEGTMPLEVEQFVFGLIPVPAVVAEAGFI